MTYAVIALEETMGTFTRVANFADNLLQQQTMLTVWAQKVAYFAANCEYLAVKLAVKS